jgi:hypothetical protein
MGQPPILTAPTSQPATPPAPAQQPAVQAAPTQQQPYAQPAPAQQPYAQPAPAPQPYAQPAPAPQPYAQPAPQRGAQPAPQPYAQPGVQPVVDWTLQVIRDGQPIDSFNGATTVGQARTDTHHKVVRHNVGCKGEPAGSIDLQRTITVSPLRANPSQAILAIEAQETLESDTVSQTPEGCTLPPQPRQVNASHPGLVVPAGQWTNWQILDRDPSLMYRVRANLAPPG